MFCNSSPPYRRWRLLAVIVLKNGTYQVGAFKHFYDALSLSIQLKAEGKHAKIIHQNGFYKVIVY